MWGGLPLVLNPNFTAGLSVTPASEQMCLYFPVTVWIQVVDNEMQNQVPKYPGTSLLTQGLFVDFALGHQASQTTRVTDV